MPGYRLVHPIPNNCCDDRRSAITFLGLRVSSFLSSLGPSVGDGGSSFWIALYLPISNPSIDTFAVVISVGHKTSVRPVATATFCFPLTV